MSSVPESVSDRNRARPIPLALVRVATLPLPAGSVRERYRLEHYAELTTYPPAQQLRYALGALTTAHALRRALIQKEGTPMTTTPRSSKPLLCRLNLHHQWRVEHSPEGDAYRRCRKCGKDDPGPYAERPSDIFGGSMGGGGVQL